MEVVEFSLCQRYKIEVGEITHFMMSRKWTLIASLEDFQLENLKANEICTVVENLFGKYVDWILKSIYAHIACFNNYFL
jgi:hypothetical protein